MPIILYSLHKKYIRKLFNKDILQIFLKQIQPATLAHKA